MSTPMDVPKSEDSPRPERWSKCNSCKANIQFGQLYWVCDVSTCNRVRTGLVFCSVSCWDAHLPAARHRHAAALECKAPSFQEWSRQQELAHQKDSETQKRSLANAAKTPADIENEILVVVSKIKDYVRSRSEMNTSNNVMAILSDRVRRYADEAITSAKRAGRQTILDRDLE